MMKSKIARHASAATADFLAAGIAAILADPSVVGTAPIVGLIRYWHYSKHLCYNRLITRQEDGNDPVHTGPVWTHPGSVRLDGRARDRVDGVAGDAIGTDRRASAWLHDHAADGAHAGAGLPRHDPGHGSLPDGLELGLAGMDHRRARRTAAGGRRRRSAD